MPVEFTTDGVSIMLCQRQPLRKSEHESGDGGAAGVVAFNGDTVVAAAADEFDAGAGVVVALVGAVVEFDWAWDDKGRRPTVSNRARITSMRGRY